ncbi:MAG: DAK2 domain-containing protein [Chloroflexota bacterium]|nr:DAK2 domain-containing protein [Chloroflexota bacterium]
MQSSNSYDGREVVQMFGSAAAWLERDAAEINSLNVFPVPDGDTGTNMLLTMRAAVDEARRLPDGSASAAARALAHGALMGARGNSGVILSQIMRGLASSLDEQQSLEGRNLAVGLTQGASLAYEAVSHPVEGTILTVIREASAAAQGVSATNDLEAILEATVSEARASVARTPQLLSVLQEAGVVDAGGLGLFRILEGLLRYMRGEAVEELAPMVSAPLPVGVEAMGEHSFGYCTEFMVEGKDVSISRIRERMEEIGESVLVVGDGRSIRVHVHTHDPGAALSYVTSMGRLRQVKVQNMDEQHEEFIAAGRYAAPLALATVVVACGEGMKEVFTSVGATVIVSGGDTMNPSTEDLLRAVASAPSEQVIVLPNNANVLLAAEQACRLSAKRCEVVPTESMPQGMAALLAFNFDADIDENVAQMRGAMGAVRTVEVTTAVRSVGFHDLPVKVGQAIAFLDGELVAAADTLSEVTLKVLGGIDLGESEIVTIYYGADTTSADAGELAAALKEMSPHLEVEVVFGGQPHYQFIISVE